MRSKVRSDLRDLRDAYYRASLRPLQRAILPVPLLVDPADPSKGLRIELRQQGEEGSCTGQALAALADIMRGGPPEGKTKSDWMASARMLVEMARNQEPTSNPDGVYSLRAALKGFYHNGVCTNALWPYAANGPRDKLTSKRSDEAREIGLGAYYRLRPLLDDYHAAIGETGCIYVAAKIHEGWEQKNLDNGKILPAKPDDRTDEAHAFLIVGYDEAGFLVLNSWGKEWGEFMRYPGIGHWSYRDWADSIMDAWVARLSVPTPTAFDIAIQEQGLQFSIEPISATSTPVVLTPPRASSNGSTPRAFLLGHYAHFEDGVHMERGSYPSDRTVVEETATILGEKDNRDRYDHVLLWVEGGTEPSEELVRLAANAKAGWLRDRVYPYHVIWCADFAKESHDVLATLFERAKQRGGERGDDLDVTIEETVRGIGRAFWRDIRHAARRAAEPGGDGVHLFETFARIGTEGGHKLHVVAEGAGALLLGEVVRQAKQGRTLRALADGIASLSLICPPVRIDKDHASIDEFERSIAPLTRKLAERKRDAVLYVPSARMESRMRVGSYGRSILHLVANAFEDRLKADLLVAYGDRKRPQGLRGPALLGMAPESSGLDKLVEGGKLHGLRVHRITEDDGRTEILGMSAMRRSPEVERLIREQITGKKS